MANQLSTQPSEVSTEERPRPPEASVVTDEIKPPGAEQAAASQADDPAGQAQTGSESAPDDSDKETKPGRRAQRKIRALNREKAELEQKLQRQSREYEELEKRLEALEKTAPKPTKPKLSDFKDEDAYFEARKAFEEAEAAEPAPRRRSRTEPDPEEPAPVATREELQAWVSEGTSKLGDAFLAAKENKGLDVDAMMGEYLLDAELGHEMYVHLHRNPKLATEIYSESSPIEKVRAMQKLERTVTKAKADAEKGKGASSQEAGGAGGNHQPRDEAGRFRTGTRAPPPGPERERGGGTVTQDLRELSMDDYAKVRTKQIKEKLGIYE